ncbi:MAG: chromate transporter, partial [Casimicrobiaceae bacterium]
VLVGRRFQGKRGAFAAFFGLMIMPMVIVMVLATIYAHFSDLDIVRHAFNGVAAGASGLVLAMGLKMARSVRKDVVMLSIALVAFAAIALARLPLLWVLGAMVPISIAIAWSRRAR